MPVILAPKDYERWLASGDPAQLPVDLPRPFDAEKMMMWKVDAAVGTICRSCARKPADMVEAERHGDGC